MAEAGCSMEDMREAWIIARLGLSRIRKEYQQGPFIHGLIEKYRPVQKKRASLPYRLKDHIIMDVRLISVFAAAVLLSGCESQGKRDATYAKVRSEGEAVVGKLKDGREIRMVVPDNGFDDRVYYVDAANVSAVEDCGKSCQKTITTTTVTTKQVVTPTQ